MKWKINNYCKVIDGLFAAFFSLAVLVSFLYFKVLWFSSGDYTAGIRIKYLTFKNMAVYMALICANYLMVRKIRLIIHEGRSQKINEKLKTAISILNYPKVCFLIAWGLWYIVYTPGNGMNDTINCLMSTTTDNQPILYQMVIYYGMKFFLYLTEDATWAYGCLVIFQMFFCMEIFSWLIRELARIGINQRVRYGLVIYYSLVPAVADYSITLVKDTLFSSILAIMIITMYQITDTGGKILNDIGVLIRMTLVCIAISATRNNGGLVCICTFIVLLFLKLDNKRKIFFGVLVVIFMNICTGKLEHYYFDNDVKFREACGVPFAQIGATLNSENLRISEKNVETLNNILPVETWKENYRPSFADLIKFDDEFNNSWLNENKSLFLQTWLQLFLQNPKVYIKAYMCHSYGFWGILPYPPDMSQSFFTKINNNTGDDSVWGAYCTSIGLRNSSIIPEKIYNILNELFKTFFKANMLFSPGLMIWIVFFCIVLLLGEKKFSTCVAWGPVVFTWVTMMIASPASQIFRYSYYLVLTMPIIVCLTLFKIRNAK